MANVIETGMILTALLFYADFDHSFDAVFSRGEGGVILEADRYVPLLTKNGGGKYGESATFVYEDLVLETVWTKDVLRYPAKGNFPYKDDSFDGTIGMWLRIDMDMLKERSLIWLDPVHLLPEGDRDSGKIWMDFVTKELPDTPIFRFGTTYSNAERQNPDNLKENHVIIVPHIDFSGESWHHIIGTWKNMNASGGSCVLELYFDGDLIDSIKGFDHRLSWDIDEWEIRIGLGFKGNIDDFFILEKFLTGEEVRMLYRSDTSLGEFLELNNK